MNKLNSAEIPLSDQTKFRLKEINKIKDILILKSKKERQRVKSLINTCCF